MGLLAGTSKCRVWLRFRKSVNINLQTNRWNTRASAIQESQVLSKWTEEDVERLMAMKAENKRTADIAAAFPRRTRMAIAVKWSKIAPRSESGRPIHLVPETKHFSDEEKRKIHELREAGFSYPQIQREHFPTRSPQSVRKTHCGSLWLQTPAKNGDVKWTTEEEKQLLHLRLDQKMNIRSAALHLGRSYTSVVDKWGEIAPPGSSSKGRKSPRARTFSAAQDDKLLELYKADVPIPEISSEFPKHSRQSVRDRVAYLSSQEGESPDYPRVEEMRDKSTVRLRELALQGQSLMEIAAQLPDMSESALRKSFAELAAEYSSTAKTRIFTSNDDEIVLRMARGRAHLKAICFALGNRFSTYHIYKRMIHLGVQEVWREAAPGYPKAFSPDEDEIIIAMSKEGATRASIQSRLNDKFSLSQIRTRVRALERREGYKAKQPLHWRLRQLEGSASVQNTPEERHRRGPGMIEGEQPVMRIARSGKMDREIGTAAITPRDELLIRMYKDNASNGEIMQALDIPTESQLIKSLEDLKGHKGVKRPRRTNRAAMTEEQLRERQRRYEIERASRAKRRDPTKPALKPHTIFTAEEDQKLTQLVQEGASYEMMMAAFDSKFSPYKLRQRRAELRLAVEMRRGRRPRPGALGSRVSTRSTPWELSEEDKQTLLKTREQGLTWQEMASQVPNVPVLVVQDYYFYGKQVIKLRADGTPRKRREPKSLNDMSQTGMVGTVLENTDGLDSEMDGRGGQQDVEHDQIEAMDQWDEPDLRTDNVGSEQHHQEDDEGLAGEFDEAWEAWDDEHGDQEDDFDFGENIVDDESVDSGNIVVQG